MPNPSPSSRRLKDLAHSRNLDAFETAFAAASVDCIVTSFLLDLLPDPTKLAKEIHRVLRPELFQCQDADGGIVQRKKL